MNKVKKTLCLVLALMLLVALVPVTALADGQPGMAMGTSVLETGANTENAATVYFGGHAWRVIGYNGNGVATAGGNMTLLAAGAISRSAYDNSQYSNIYGTNTNRPEGEQDSALKRAVDAIAGQLTAGEQGAVAPRTLTGGSANYGQEGYGENLISGPTVENALLWPLSMGEANQVPDVLRALDPEHPYWAINYWWLRSPGADVNSAEVVHGDGGVYNISFYGMGFDYDDFGVRPAFNVNLNSVLFTSAAEGGKSSGDAEAGALTAVSPNTTNAWKLTVADQAHAGFTVEPSITYDESTRIVTVPYSGAVTGQNEYISAIIVNSSGSITYYGRVAEAATEGSVTINVSDKYNCGDTLYVFNEQYHDGTATDYASPLRAVSLQGGHTEVEDPAVPATCTETGLTAGVHCSVCGEVITAQETVDALGHDWGDWTVTREAQPGAAGERQRTCQRDGCGEVETEVIPALPVYTVTQGAGGNWTKGSGTSFTITVKRSEDDANCFAHYVETLIDGQAVTVTAASGSTVVTIPANTLEALSAGTHTVTVKFDDGEVSTQLTIKAAEQETTAPANNTPTSPTTGDGSHTGLWIGLACAAGIACAAAAVAAKKRRA